MKMILRKAFFMQRDAWSTHVSSHVLSHELIGMQLVLAQQANTSLETEHAQLAERLAHSAGHASSLEKQLSDAQGKQEATINMRCLHTGMSTVPDRLLQWTTARLDTSPQNLF